MTCCGDLDLAKCFSSHLVAVEFAKVSYARVGLGTSVLFALDRGRDFDQDPKFKTGRVDDLGVSEKAAQGSGVKIL